MGAQYVANGVGLPTHSLTPRDSRKLYIDTLLILVYYCLIWQRLHVFGVVEVLNS